MDRGTPEVKELLLLEVAHSAPVRALYVVRHNLQVGLHVHRGCDFQLDQN